MKSRIPGRFSLFVLVAVAGFGCPQNRVENPDNFEQPVALAVGPAVDLLNPALGARMTAFVADQGNRAIGRVDLEDRKVRTPLPFGRLPGRMAAVHNGAGEVDELYVIDDSAAAVQVLDVRTALEPTAGTPTFTGDSSSLSLVDIQVEAGLTPTQTWSVEYEGSLDQWVVTGDGLGHQKQNAVTGDAYVSDNGEVRFVIQQVGAAPVDGDTFVFDTDTGMRTIDMGTGRGISLQAVPGDTYVVVSMTEPGRLVAISVADDTTTEIPLPAGSIPTGIALTPDQNTMLVADRGNASLHVVDVSSGDPSLFTVNSIAAPSRARQIAVTPDGRRGFLLSDAANDVFVLDIRPGINPAVTPIDVIGRTPDIDPVPFPAGIRSLGSASQVHTMRTGAAAFPVVVTTYSGNAIFLNGNTGCQDFGDDRGARLEVFRFRDEGAYSIPLFQFDSFTASRCGGIARTEDWSIIYSQSLGGYEVIGSVSGPQTNVALENEVYSSDLGEISFQIDSGAVPTTEGDTFTIGVVDGIAPLRLGELPGDVVSFTLPDPTTGADVEYTLVANPGNDLLSQIDLDRRRVVANYR